MDAMGDGRGGRQSSRATAARSLWDVAAFHSDARERDMTVQRIALGLLHLHGALPVFLSFHCSSSICAADGRCSGATVRQRAATDATTQIGLGGL